MKNKKLIALMWVTSLLPGLILALCWSRLPEQVPMQWGFDSQVNSYGPKNNLWPIAAIAPVLCLVFQFLPKFDPKKENYEKFQKIYDGFALAIPLFLTGMMALVMVETMNPGSTSIGRVVMVCISLLLMAIGCIMGKLKTNWFMGIRTPWALSDPDVWNKTNRLGGWVFFLSGLMELPLALLASERVMAYGLLALLGAGVVLVYVMSYVWFKRKMSGKE